MAVHYSTVQVKFVVMQDTAQAARSGRPGRGVGSIDPLECGPRIVDCRARNSLSLPPLLRLLMLMLMLVFTPLGVDFGPL